MASILDKDTVKGIDWKDSVNYGAALSTAAAAIATAYSDKLFIVKMGSLAYLTGQNAPGNTVPNIKPAFDAFAAVQYSATSGRKLGDKTRGNYESGYGGLGVLGHASRVWQNDLAFETIMAPANRKGLGCDKIGGWARAIVKAYPETAPTVTQIMALQPKGTPETATIVAGKIRKMIMDNFGPEGTYVSCFGDDVPGELTRLDLLGAIDTMVDALPEEETADDALDFKQQASVLRAKMKADAKAAKEAAGK